MVSRFPGAESDMLCLVVRLLAKHRFEGTRLVIMHGALDLRADAADTTAICPSSFLCAFPEVCDAPIGPFRALLW